MANPWFRMYAEFANDPKVQMLSETDQRRYIMLLCMRCGNGDVTLREQEIAFQLRISDEEWAKTRAVLLAKNLIQKNNMPTAWDKRQYISDVSTSRVYRHREKHKQSLKQACNVSVTPPDSETEQIQKQNRKEIKEAQAPCDPPSLPDFIPAAVWSQFLEMRRKIRKSPTDAAQILIFRKIDELRKRGHDPTAVLEQSIRNSWQDVFELKGNNDAKQRNANTKSGWHSQARDLASEYLREAAMDSAGQGEVIDQPEPDLRLAAPVRESA